MSVQGDIFEWARGFEPWKQDLFLRASSAAELTDDDIKDAVGMLLGEQSERSGPREVTLADIPGGVGGEQPLTLEAIFDVQNVNALVADQILSFQPTGITIVYGANGAGKTGYSRILKHVGRTLSREPVQTNVLSAAATPPNACVAIRIGDQEQKVTTRLDQAPPPELARICVFDVGAGNRYITDDNEADYIPTAVRYIELFAKGLRSMEGELDRRISVATPAAQDLSVYGDGTAVHTRLTDITVIPPDSDIERLATLTAAERTQRNDLRRQFGEIIADNAPQLRESAEREAQMVTTLRNELTNIARHVSVAALEEARNELTRLAEAEDAVSLAAKRFDGEPISGVGTEPWRVMWRAAKLFMHEVHGQLLPADHDPAHCPLCMQVLGAQARERLAHFDTFITENVSAQREIALRTVDARRSALPDVAAFLGRHEDALNLLGRKRDQPGRELVDWLDQAGEQIGRLRTGDIAGDTGLAEPPVTDANTWIDARTKAAEQHAALENIDEQKRIRGLLAELDARAELHGRLADVLKHLASLREVKRLTEAKSKLSTTGISHKITEFSKSFIQADLATALNDQLRALAFDGLEVKTTTRTVTGTPLVGLRFKTIKGATITDILSQGEQRRLALAMFLAEMSVINDSNPIVLDDPASSVDQEGRRHIARTLVQLAANRQVIVFTHEFSFINMLRKLAGHERPGVAVHVQHVIRLGRDTGHVRPSLPWEGLSAKDRVEPLRIKLKAAGDAYANHDPEVYGTPVRDFCNFLRQAFER